MFVVASAARDDNRSEVIVITLIFNRDDHEN